jgi:hypothetical protein
MRGLGSRIHPTSQKGLSAMDRRIILDQVEDRRPAMTIEANCATMSA